MAVTGKARGVDPFLAEYLLGRPRSAMLRVLFGAGSRSWSVRELRDRTGLSEASIRRELRAMHVAGLLARSRTGEACARYQAEMHHVSAEAVRALLFGTVHATIGVEDRMEESSGR